MHRYAFTIVKDKEEAKDVVQKAFIKLWQKRHAVNMAQGARLYLYTAVHNLSLNVLRDTKTRAKHISQYDQQDINAVWELVAEDSFLVKDSLVVKDSLSILKDSSFIDSFPEITLLPKKDPSIFAWKKRHRLRSTGWQFPSPFCHHRHLLLSPRHPTFIPANTLSRAFR